MKEVKTKTITVPTLEILGYCLLCEHEFPVRSIYEREQICPECKAIWREIKKERKENGLECV